MGGGGVWVEGSRGSGDGGRGRGRSGGGGRGVLAPGRVIIIARLGRCIKMTHITSVGGRPGGWAAWWVGCPVVGRGWACRLVWGWNKKEKKKGKIKKGG